MDFAHKNADEIRKDPAMRHHLIRHPPKNRGFMQFKKVIIPEDEEFFIY